jgi:hypothetical protein
MDPAERFGLIEYLKTSQRDYLLCFDELEEAQSSTRPRPESWTITECAEHVTIVEMALLQRLKSSTVLEEPLLHPEQEATIRSRAADRTSRFEAPDRVKPTGRFPSLKDSLDQFRAAREGTIQFVETVPDLRRLSGMHPMFGMLNGVELVYFIGSHPLRHAEQIRELRQSLGK